MDIIKSLNKIIREALDEESIANVLIKLGFEEQADGRFTREGNYLHVVILAPDLIKYSRYEDDSVKDHKEYEIESSEDVNDALKEINELVEGQE